MYKTIALPTQKKSSWNLFSWVSCGSSSDIITPAINAPTKLEKSLSTQADLIGFIREQYLVILTEARCPCSGKAMPCPSAVTQFESALATEHLNLESLEMGLFGLQSAIEKNIASIENKETIRSFLTKLQNNSNKLYSEQEIKDLIEVINASLALLA
jgi:hypothetical protein